jgi:hypothetical protein
VAVKPLYKRIEEKEKAKMVNKERERQELAAVYKVQKALQNPSRNEIASHMRAHDEWIDQRKKSKLNMQEKKRKDKEKAYTYEAGLYGDKDRKGYDLGREQREQQAFENDYRRQLTHVAHSRIADVFATGQSPSPSKSFSVSRTNNSNSNGNIGGNFGVLCAHTKRRGLRE